MRYRRLVLAAVMIGLGLGCGSPGTPQWVYSTAPLEGTLGVAFVNETPYTISTYWGTYNPLDLQNGVVVNSLALAGGATSQTSTTVATTRNLDVAGAALRKAAETGRPTGITPSDITDNITFKDDNGNVIGTALPAHFLVGIDYASGDFVEIHFKQAAGTTDQFFVVMVATGQ